MKTEEEILQHKNNLNMKLKDALENPETTYNANDLQTAIQELEWVLG